MRSMASGVTRFFSISSDSSARARASTALGGSGWWSCPSCSATWSLLGLEIALPEIDPDPVADPPLVAPQLHRVEAHGVEGLGQVAAGGAGVGQVEAAVAAVDDPDLAPDVARHADVAGGVQVAGPHPVAGLEPRRRTLPARRHPLADDPQHALGEGTLVPARRPRPSRLGCSARPRLQLLPGGHALLHHQRLHRGQPEVEVGLAQVLGGRDPLPAVAELVQVEDPPLGQDEAEGEDPALPAGVEGVPVVPGIDRAEGLHAAHVVDAVHSDDSIQPHGGRRHPDRRPVRAGSGGSQSQPFSRAMRTASIRLRASSFWMAAERWLRTVPSDRYSRLATSARVAPSAEAASTSVSRGDSGLSPSLSAWMASWGSTTRSPAIVRRMATASSGAGASLSMKPLAPADRARRR